MDFHNHSELFIDRLIVRMPIVWNSFIAIVGTLHNNSGTLDPLISCRVLWTSIKCCSGICKPTICVERGLA